MSAPISHVIRPGTPKVNVKTLHLSCQLSQIALNCSVTGIITVIVLRYLCINGHCHNSHASLMTAPGDEAYLNFFVLIPSSRDFVSNELIVMLIE